MIDRRTLLARVAAMGLVGALGTASILPRTQGPPDRASWRRALLADAWRRAASAGRPLLAIIIPDDDSQRWFAADIWGEVITHGSEEAIAALAAAELVCATHAELVALVPAYAPVAKTLLVRLDADAVPARFQSFEPSVAPIDPEAAAVRQAAIQAAQETDAAWWSMPSAEDLHVDARIAAMEAMILSAIQPTAASRRADLTALRSAPIPGSRWMVSGGCASSFETADPLISNENDMAMLVGCGMGHVNSRSVRFLDFLTEPVPVPEP